MDLKSSLRKRLGPMNAPWPHALQNFSQARSPKYTSEHEHRLFLCRSSEDQMKAGLSHPLLQRVRYSTFISTCEFLSRQTSCNGKSLNQTHYHGLAYVLSITRMLRRCRRCFPRWLPMAFRLLSERPESAMAEENNNFPHFEFGFRSTWEGEGYMRLCIGKRMISWTCIDHMDTISDRPESDLFMKAILFDWFHIGQKRWWAWKTTLGNTFKLISDCLLYTSDAADE